jgi:DNA-binding winged helix-turn-helix (wHTH) protein
MNGAQREQSTPFYEFGPFRVDSVKYVLTRDGEVVPLNLKAFEILLALIQNRGQLLEKNELLQRVWPDTVVEENNLARNVSALRKALDEQPNEHHYILTVPGRGYRFVASERSGRRERRAHGAADQWKWIEGRRRRRALPAEQR